MNWEQLKAILALRFQLTRNQWTRSKFGIRGVIAVALGVVAAVVAVGSFIGALVLGLNAADFTPDVLMFIWAGIIGAFLFFWLIGLLVELQRSETIDLQRLMHLPVRLGQVFTLNFIASHFVFSIILIVPAMLGFALGLSRSHGPLLLLQIPLALAVVFMITAWTYCLKGWIASLMANPRRRRTVLALVTMTIVVLAQLPNIYFNVIAKPEMRRRAAHHEAPPALAWQKYAPPFWASLGVRDLARREIRFPLAATAGCAALGSLGLFRAYRATSKFYHGDEGRRAPKIAASAAAAAPAPKSVFEKRLPFLSDEATAVALANFRCMLRAPEIKITWAVSILATITLAAVLVFRVRAHLPTQLHAFLVPAALSFSALTLTQFFSNQFGYDRDAFQTYVLSPIKRRDLLLGKNVASLPIIFIAGFVWIILGAVFIGLSPFEAAAGIFQIAVAAFIVITAGNFLSVYVPFRIRAGSLKPTKISGGRGCLVAFSQLVLPFTLLPIFIGPSVEAFLTATGDATHLPLNLLLSAALALLAALVYWFLLDATAPTLQKRETNILEVLTTEVE